jgi:hypothetical protein
MSRIASNIDPNSENFKRYHAFNHVLAAQLQARIAQTALAGPEAIRARHAGRGKSRPAAGLVVFEHRMFNQKNDLVCRCKRTALSHRTRQ